MDNKIALIISVLSIGICICTGCGKDTKIATEYAQRTADIVESGNMKKINELIFGYQESDVDNKIEAFIGTSQEEDSGILKDIFKKCSLEVLEISKDEIKYEIESPDLKGIFEELGENESNLSETEFAGKVKQYIEQAKCRKRTVNIPYMIADGKVFANYRNEEFINAITGGLLESYQKFCQQMLEEYAG